MRYIPIHHLLAISLGAPAKKGGRKGSYGLGDSPEAGVAVKEGCAANRPASASKAWVSPSGTGDVGVRQGTVQRMCS